MLYTDSDIAAVGERDRTTTGSAEGVVRVSRVNSPIVVGPWRGEVGTEMTYWQPWVQTVASQVEGFWDRAVVVSRGGAGALYHPGVKTVDLYAIRGIESVVEENLRAKDEFGVNKPVACTKWEWKVIQDVGNQLNLGVKALLHPSLMVSGCQRYWDGEKGFGSIAVQMDVAPLEKPKKPDWLPASYTAVKWYHREGVVNPTVEAAWRRIVADLSARGPVVWVGQGSCYDRHVEGEHGVRVMPKGPVEDNLLRQAAVIAHAERFVGTYGGLAQFALRLGVPTVAFYPEKEPRHRPFNQWIARQTGVPFISGSLADADVMRGVFA